MHALRQSGYDGLLESVLEETVPLEGRMIHGLKECELYEQAQAYDIHGRVSHARIAFVASQSD